MGGVTLERESGTCFGCSKRRMSFEGGIIFPSFHPGFSLYSYVRNTKWIKIFEAEIMLSVENKRSYYG
jgi:hypothetical protein